MVDSAPAMISGGNSGAIIVPGNPEKSLLYRAVAWLEEDTEMPPKKKLSEAEIGHFRKWISLGAPDPRISEPKPRTPPSQLWSLKPVTSPPPPLFPIPNGPEIKLINSSSQSSTKPAFPLSGTHRPAL